MSNDNETEEKSNILSIFKELNKPYTSSDSPPRTIGGRRDRAGRGGRGQEERSELYDVLRRMIEVLQDTRTEVVELRAALTLFLTEMKKERKK